MNQHILLKMLLSSATLSVAGICLGVLIVWVGITDGLANLVQFILYKLHIIKSFNPIISKHKKRRMLK